MTTQRFAVNGIELVADVEGDGPAILFVHGYPLSRAMWAHQVANLDGWRRIAPDLRGMGESGVPEGDYSMATYATDLAVLLDRLGVQRVVVCAQSMGGYVAFEFMRRWRRRVCGLVLVDTRAEADTLEGKRGRDVAATLAMESGAAAIAEQMLPKMLSRSARDTRPDIVAQVRKMMAATPVRGIVGALQAMKGRPDSTPLLAALDMPTLILVGAEDEITSPDQARAMAQAIPGARFTIAPRAAHLPPVERPEVTTDVLREFLRSLPEYGGAGETSPV